MHLERPLLHDRPLSHTRDLSPDNSARQETQISWALQKGGYEQSEHFGQSVPFAKPVHHKIASIKCKYKACLPPSEIKWQKTTYSKSQQAGGSASPSRGGFLGKDIFQNRRHLITSSLL